MVLVAAAAAGLAIWLGLQPRLARQLETARTLRVWQHRSPAGSGAGTSRWFVAAAVAGTLLGLAGFGWWQGPLLVFAVQRATRVAETVARQREQASLTAALPTLWLLFAACQQAGLGLRQSVRVLAEALSGSAGRRLQAVHTALAAGHSLAAAGQTAATEDRFQRGWGLLVRAEAAGSPVGPLLRRLAAEAAAEQRWLRQAQLARLPLWLTLVTVFCFLPGVLVMTVLPQLLFFMTQML